MPSIPPARRAAANTIIRKRAVLHGALGYAAEAGLLPDNPLDSTRWQVPQSSAANRAWHWADRPARSSVSRRTIVPG